MLRDFRVLNHLSSLFSRLPCVDCLQIFSELLPGGPLLMTWAAWNCLKLFCFSSFARGHPMSLIFLPAPGIMNDECGRAGRSKIVRDFFKIFAVANSWFLERSSFLTARKCWKIIRGATQTHQVAYLHKPSLQNLQMFTCYQCCAQHVAATKTTLQFCNIHQYSI